jgi:hypothetical protein
MKIALAVNSLLSGYLILEIPHHDVSASEYDFSVALLIRVINLKICSSNAETDRLEVKLLVAV